MDTKMNWLICCVAHMPAIATQLLAKFINHTGILDSRRNVVTKGPESLQALVAAEILEYKTASGIFMGEGR